MPVDPVVGRLMTTAESSSGSSSDVDEKSPVIHEHEDVAEQERSVSIEAAKATRPDDIPDITSLFTDGPVVQARKETAFDGLETHEVRSSSRSNNRGKLEHRETPDGIDYESAAASSETEAPDSALEDSHTIGPYDSVHEDYVDDQPEPEAGGAIPSPVGAGTSVNIKEAHQQQDEDSSTFLPEAEPDYRYNMKWRSMGKVLDPPSK